ncbi:hypothetical protein [Arenimonas composti]|uniref:hypothetical protein n=1 Tax=Arenimonas composti TaxID=370776 RepID=UPI0012B60FB1|nr:hypothetical protein [Arenimonas composti]
MKKRYRHALLIAVIAMGWIASAAYMRRGHESATLELRDFYKPSAAAVTQCVGAARELREPISRQQCEERIFADCKNFGPYGTDSLRCGEAMAAMEQAKRVSEHRQSRRNEIELWLHAAFGLALLVGLVSAFIDLVIHVAPERVAAWRKKRATSREGRDRPVIHEAARVAGFFWGKTERRFRSVKRSFDDGRNSSETANPPDE